MRDVEILQRAIDKAVSNGWNDPTETIFIEEWSKTSDEIKAVFVERVMNNLKWFAIIFSHDFARAFFGVDYTQHYYDTTPETGWAWHLQQMVIEHEPLQYLAKF